MFFLPVVCTLKLKATSDMIFFVPENISQGDIVQIPESDTTIINVTESVPSSTICKLSL